MNDSTSRFIEDADGNVVQIGAFLLGNDNAMPTSSTTEVNLRWLKDNVSGRFYPITSRSYILGGIGRGSSREVLDFSNYIANKYEGTYKLVTMGNHVKYYVLEVNIKTGTLSNGDNIITNALPVTYYPQKHLVFTGSIDPDNTSKTTIYLSATDGRIHCYVDARHEIQTEPKFALVPVLTATKVVGIAPFIE